MPFGSLHHIEIYVSDLNASLSFWDWFFNYFEYKIYQKWSNGVSYKQDSTYIVLVQTELNYIKKGYNRKNTGLNHLAFWGKSKDQIDEFRELLREKSIKLLYDDKFPYAGGENYYALYFEEPLDRIKIEIVAPDS